MTGWPSGVTARTRRPWNSARSSTPASPSSSSMRSISMGSICVGAAGATLPGWGAGGMGVCLRDGGTRQREGQVWIVVDRRSQGRFLLNGIDVEDVFVETLAPVMRWTRFGFKKKPTAEPTGFPIFLVAALTAAAGRHRLCRAGHRRACHPLVSALPMPPTLAGRRRPGRHRARVTPARTRATLLELITVLKSTRR